MNQEQWQPVVATLSVLLGSVVTCAWARADEVPRLTLVALKDSEPVTQRY